MIFRRVIVLFVLVVSAVSSLACTSAIISARSSASGRPMLWKHRDTSNANSRVAYISASAAVELSYVGVFNANDTLNRQAWMGMNEAGFAIMNTASYNILAKGVKAGDKEGYVMARALGVCRTVEDFAHFLDSLSRPMGVEANFGVIDALGYGAYFETGNDSYVRYDLKDAEDGMLVRTNYSLSGQPGEGSGYMRYANAIHLLTPAAKDCKVTPELLTETLSRSFYRDDIGYDLLEDTVQEVLDLDFIPRYTSVATVVIEGMVPCDTLPSTEEVARQYIMWTGLGYPPLAEMRPVWMLSDGVEADLQGQGRNNHSPLADMAQSKRLEIFSTRSEKENKRFVNLNKLKEYMSSVLIRNREVYDRYRNR